MKDCTLVKITKTKEFKISASIRKGSWIFIIINLNKPSLLAVASVVVGYNINDEK